MLQTVISAKLNIILAARHAAWAWFQVPALMFHSAQTFMFPQYELRPPATGQSKVTLLLGHLILMGAQWALTEVRLGGRGLENKQ